MASTQKPSTFATILQMVGLLAFSVFTFIGLCYYTRGNIYSSGLFTILFLFSLIFLVQYLVKFKTKKRNEINYKPELILLGGYLAITVVSFPFIFHSIFVETSKSEIKVQAKNRLTEVRNVIDSYSEEIDKKIEVSKTNMDRYLLNCFDASSAEDQANWKDSVASIFRVSTVETDSTFSLFDFIPSLRSIPLGKKNENLNKEIQDEADTLFKKNVARYLRNSYDTVLLNRRFNVWHKQAFNAIENWDFLNVSDKYYECETRYNGLINKIREKIPGFYEGKTLSSMDVKLDSPLHSMSLGSSKAWGISILITLVIHLCVLIIYLLGTRSEGPPLKRYKGDSSNRPQGIIID